MQVHKRRWNLDRNGIDIDLGKHRLYVRSMMRRHLQFRHDRIDRTFLDVRGICRSPAERRTHLPDTERFIKR